MIMENLFRDLRFSFRMLIKSKGFTVVAVLSIALGIGDAPAPRIDYIGTLRREGVGDAVPIVGRANTREHRVGECLPSGSATDG